MFFTKSIVHEGIQVSVVGSLGSIDVYGMPQSKYLIDGVTDGVYTAPYIPDPDDATHVSFFVSPLLEPGKHTIQIINVNGTKPSTLWLDYILYTPGVAASTTPDSTPSSNSSTPDSGSASNTQSASSILNANSSDSSTESQNTDTSAVATPSGMTHKVSFIRIIVLISPLSITSYIWLF